MTSLLLPIVLSAIVVFVVSSILHMVLTYHRNDYKRVPDENAVMDALRPFNLPPGDYLVPAAGSPAAMRSEDFKAKVKKGPVVIMTIVPPGPPAMAKNLVMWFIFSLVVSGFSAYVTGRALGPGASYLEVFRFAGTVAFMGYGLGLVQLSIWYSRNWVTTLKSVLDGLIYGLMTAGTFGWLWPK